MKNLYSNLLFLVAFLLNAQATTHTFTASGIAFSPTNIGNVSVGDTVRWVWSNGDHTTTSVNVPSGAATWSNPLNNLSPSFEYPVTVAGNYSFKCIPHESFGMGGTFTVTGGVTVCDTLVCDDSDACTTDDCVNDACVFTPIICDDTDTCTTDTCDNGTCVFTPVLGCGVGINEPASLRLGVYPNPVQDVLTVAGENAMLTHISLTDISGKQVYGAQNIDASIHSIQMSGLSEGVYLLYIDTQAGQAVRKVWVE